MNSNPGGHLGGDRHHFLAMTMLRLERERQMDKWGVQNHPNGTGSEMAHTVAEQWKTVCDIKNSLDNDDWATIAAEEFFEALAETELNKLIDEVAQFTAVGIAWLEDLLRQKSKQENS